MEHSENIVEAAAKYRAVNPDKSVGVEGAGAVPLAVCRKLREIQRGQIPGDIKIDVEVKGERQFLHLLQIHTGIKRSNRKGVLQILRRIPLAAAGSGKVSHGIKVLMPVGVFIFDCGCAALHKPPWEGDGFIMRVCRVCFFLACVSGQKHRIGINKALYADAVIVIHKNVHQLMGDGTTVLGQSASVRCQTQFSRFGVLDRISGRVRLCQIFRADIELIAHVVSVLGLLAVFPGNGCQRVCFIVIQDFKTDLRAKLIQPCGFFKCGKSRPEQLHGLWFYAVFRHLNQPCKIIGTYPFQSLL